MFPVGLLNKFESVLIFFGFVCFPLYFCLSCLSLQIYRSVGRIVIILSCSGACLSIILRSLDVWNILRARPCVQDCAYTLQDVKVIKCLAI